jgi:hypothetical protein
VPPPGQLARKLRAILYAAASLRYIAYGLRDLFVCLGVLLIPTSLCAVASLILFLPDQTRDYYRLLVEDLADPINVKHVTAIVDAIFPVVFLLGMAACLSFSAVVLLAERNRPSLYRTACARRAITLSPVLFGTLPLIAAIAGFSASSSAIDLQTEKASIEGIQGFGDETFVKQLNFLFAWAEQGDRYFSLGLWILIAVTIAFFLISTLIVLLNRRAAEHQRERLWHIARRVFVASITFSLTAIVLIAAFPVPIGQILGSITVFAIFIGCLAINATGLSIWSRRLDFPIIPTMLALAVFLAWTDLNDDHELRRIDKSGHQVSSSVTSTSGPAGDVEDEFEKWYGTRIDKDNGEFSKERGYPVPP